MSNAVSFEQLDEQGDDGFTNRPKKAIWEINLEAENNDENILKWLNGELEFLLDENQFREQRMKRNLALYKGIQYQSQETRADVRDRIDDKSRIVQKIVANHLFDLVANRVAKLVKFKPAVSVLPTNNEFTDKIAAKSTKMLLDHIWYLQKFEGKLTVKAAKIASILGEAYLCIDWDKSAGDVSKLDKKARDEGEAAGVGRKIRLLDEHGQPQKDDAGNPVFINKTLMTGDVRYRIKTPFDLYFEKKNDFDDVNYFYEREVMPVAEARAKWPKQAKNIKADDTQHIWDFEKMQLEPPKDRVVVWHFIHKGIPVLEEGRAISFTKTAILENQEFGSDELPLERLTDVDLIGEQHAISIIDIVKGLTGSYNNLTNMILRNQILVAHPKWMVPAGSTKKEQLGNDVTIVTFKGPVAPTLAQANPTGAETFEFRKELKEEFQQISGVFGVSRGEPPAGIKAGVALQFLAEQENERFNENVLKYNEWIRRVSIKTLAKAGEKYDDNEDRLIRVLGKDNEWMNVFFKTANLKKNYDIRIQNSSALPQSKAARIQTLLDLSERYPERVDPDQILDMIDLAQSDKFLEISTVSVKSAEAENEAMSEGDINGPEQYEDLIQHWKIHVRHLQQFNFKNQTPDKTKDRFEKHLRATEMLMWEKAQINPFFGQKASMLELFPIFFVPPVSPPEIPPNVGGGAPQPTADPLRANALTSDDQVQVNPPSPSVLSQSEGTPSVPKTSNPKPSRQT